MSNLNHKDIKAWWRSACCGPTTDDTNNDCGFCGLNVLECCNEHTDFLKTATPEQLLGYARSQLGYPPDEGKPGWPQPCGGSGFHCPNCGRMWAQDSCGGSGWGGEHSSDGQPLLYEPATDTDKMQMLEVEKRVNCVCGETLFYLLKQE